MTPGVDKEAELLLVKAAEDEAVLAADIPDGPFGFHVQQAVEKLLKALLCQRSIKYKRTHDLDYLTQLLEDQGEVIPKDPKERLILGRLRVLELHIAMTRCRKPRF